MSFNRILAPTSLLLTDVSAAAQAYGLRFFNGREVVRPIGVKEWQINKECTRIVLGFAGIKHISGQSANYLGTWKLSGSGYQLTLDHDWGDLPERPTYDVEWMDDKLLCDMFPSLRLYLFAGCNGNSSKEKAPT